MKNNTNIIAQKSFLDYSYRDFSSTEIRELSPKIQEDFNLFKKYNGYKHYKNFKERVN